MLSRYSAFTLLIIYSFSLNASPIHDDAKKRDWGKMFALLRTKAARINDLEEGTGNTVLDIALRIAPTDVVQALIRIGGQPGVMIEMEPDLAKEQPEDEVVVEALTQMIDKYGANEHEDEASSGEWPAEMETPLAVAPFTERDATPNRRNYASDGDDDLDVSKILNFDSVAH